MDHAAEEDMEAPLAYLHDEHCLKFKPPLTKLYITVGTGDDERERKVTIRTFGDTEYEDAESFFLFLEDFEKEMTRFKKWDKDANHNADVTELFTQFDQCLRHSAQTDWYDVLGGPVPTGTSWQEWKESLSQYIMEKILPENAYRKQRRYMEHRKKPKALSLDVWWRRVKTLSHYLRFFVDKDTMEEYSGGVHKRWKDLWVNFGPFNQYELNNIMVDNVPDVWREEFYMSTLDVGDTEQQMLQYF